MLFMCCAAGVQLMIARCTEKKENLKSYKHMQNHEKGHVPEITIGRSAGMHILECD